MSILIIEILCPTVCLYLLQKLPRSLACRRCTLVKPTSMSVMLLAIVLTLGGVLGWMFTRVGKWLSFLESELLSPLPASLDDPSSPQPVPLPSIFEPATKALSIIVPAYNEEERLGATLDETLKMVLDAILPAVAITAVQHRVLWRSDSVLRQYLAVWQCLTSVYLRCLYASYLQRRRDKQGPNFTYEIIIVDDGSIDHTTRVALDYTRKFGFDAVRLLRVMPNHGKGHAVRRGMLAARGEYLLFMDADGATRVSDLQLLEEALGRVMVVPGQPSASSHGAAAGTPAAPLGAAFGSRAHLESAARARRSKLRNFLTNGFHALVTLVAGRRVRDTQCGFKLFTRHTATLVASNQRLQRWCFDVELLLICEQLGVPVIEVPVQWTEMPGSKIRATSVLSMAAELALLKIAYQVTGTWKVYSEAELLAKKSQ